MGRFVMCFHIKINSTRRCVFPALVAMFLAAVQPAYAFKLAPITMDYEPSGRRATQSFRVDNDSDKPIAVQVSMLTRDMDFRGKETNAPADDDFIVFPSQILLKPRQVQMVRVQWVGNPNPEKELAFRILAEQLPVALEKEETGGARIKVVVRYLGSVYIVPKGARAGVALESATARIADDGSRELELIFQNRGTARALLRDLTLRLQSGGRTVTLGPEQLKGIAGENMLAGIRRRFVLPWPEELPDGPIEVEFEFTGRDRRL